MAVASASMLRCAAVAALLALAVGAVGAARPPVLERLARKWTQGSLDSFLKPKEPATTTATTTTAATQTDDSDDSSSSSSSSGKPKTHKFTIVSNCSQKIWVAVLGNPGQAEVASGGFVMPHDGSSVDVEVPFGWEGRFWARAGCNFTDEGYCDPPYQPCCASGSCLTADGRFGLRCAQSGLAPTSLVEMSLDNAGGTGFFDVYDTSLVDGWSIPLGMRPVEGTYRTKPYPGVHAPWCKHTGCLSWPRCPKPYRVAGSAKSCWSPCQATVNANASAAEVLKMCCVCTESNPSCNCLTSTDRSSPEHGCCNGGYGCTPFHTPHYPASTVCDPWNRDRARRWSPAGLDYIASVERYCPFAYSWQFDDKAATFMCAGIPHGMKMGMVDYVITFTDLFIGDNGRELRREE